MQDSKLCPYCHQQIHVDLFDKHLEEHRELREDGQQKDYATLPPEQRAKISNVDHVPTDYIHQVCDSITTMPQDIIETYLKNPFFYASDETYCVGCEKHVHISKCEWVDTGENMGKYFERLRAENPDLKPNMWQKIVHWLLSER